MKLYYHPISTTCRPIMLLAADDDIKLDYQLVDLFKGEHIKPEYARGFNDLIVAPHAGQIRHWVERVALA